MDSLIRFEACLSRAIEAAVTLCFAVILCLTVMLVLLRYGFNSSIIWGSEAMNYLFIYTTALGAARAVGDGSHIRIGCLVELASGTLRRVLDFVGYALIGLINGVLAWYSLPWITSAGGFESPVMRIPMWVAEVTVPVGCTLAVLYCLLHMLRVVTGSEPEGDGAC